MTQIHDTPSSLSLAPVTKQDSKSEPGYATSHTDHPQTTLTTAQVHPKGFKQHHTNEVPLDSQNPQLSSVTTATPHREATEGDAYTTPPPSQSAHKKNDDLISYASYTSYTLDEKQQKVMLTEEKQLRAIVHQLQERMASLEERVLATARDHPETAKSQPAPPCANLAPQNLSNGPLPPPIAAVFQPRRSSQFYCSEFHEAIIPGEIRYKGNESFHPTIDPCAPRDASRPCVVVDGFTQVLWGVKPEGVVPLCAIAADRFLRNFIIDGIKSGREDAEFSKAKKDFVKLRQCNKTWKRMISSQLQGPWQDHDERPRYVLICYLLSLLGQEVESRNWRGRMDWAILSADATWVWLQGWGEDSNPLDTKMKIAGIDEYTIFGAEKEPDVLLLDLERRIKALACS